MNMFLQGRRLTQLMWTFRFILPFLITLSMLGLAAFTNSISVHAANQAPISGENLNPEVVSLGLNKSMVIDLPRDVKDVLVSNPAKADAIMRTSRRAYIIGREVGETNIFFFDNNGQHILSLELQIDRDLAGLRSMLRRLIPDANISVDSINENIVLTGTAPNPAASGRAADLAGRFAGDPEKVLNMLAIQDNQQVMIKVVIAEMERESTKQFGVDIDAVIRAGSATFNLVSQNPFSLTGTPLASSLAGTALRSGNVDIDAAVRAMERNGSLRTLAEPTLSAISGESASFLAGGEFPIPVGSDENGVTIEYKPFGVALAFTPIVLSSGRISLRIKTEVSETTTDGSFSLGSGNTNAIVSVPGLAVRRAETTVELPSGGTLAIAGLIKDETRQSVDGIAGIKDLPILGALFRSQEFKNSESELVVLITPYLVQPAHRDDFALPTDGFTQPPDLKSIILGRLNEVYGVRGAQPSGNYQGQYGFIVD